jgi:hypothetical protein
MMTIKNLYLFPLAILSLWLVSGCKKERKVPIEIKMSMPYSTPAINVVDSFFELETFEFETAFDDVFIEKNSRKDKLEHALVEMMDMEILFPVTQNFNWLQTIEVFLDAEGLEPRLGASLLNIPKNKRFISLNPGTESLHEHLKKDKIKLRIRMKLNAPIERGIIISFKTSFKGTTLLL